MKIAGVHLHLVMLKPLTLSQGLDKNVLLSQYFQNQVPNPGHTQVYLSERYKAMTDAWQAHRRSARATLTSSPRCLGDHTRACDTFTIPRRSYYDYKRTFFEDSAVSEVKMVDSETQDVAAVKPGKLKIC